MLIQTIAVEYLRYLQFDRNFKDMAKRRYRIGRIVMFWLHREVESLTMDDILQFKKWFIDHKCKETYINTFLFTVRSLFRFCNDQGITTIEPNKIKPFPIKRKQVKFLTKDQMIELLRYFDGTRLQDYRNRAITALMMDAGLRIGECMALNRADLEQILNGMLVVIGKGSKERPAFFTWSRQYLEDYIDQRVDNSEALFITHCTDSRFRVRRLAQDGFRKYLREANGKLDFQVSPHILRKTALNNWKNNGMDIKSVSLIAGHESVMTTEKYYLGVDWNRLQMVHKQFSFI